MSELDEHMRESTELTSVLASPLLDGDAHASFDMDAEFEELQQDLELQRSLIPSPTPETAIAPLQPMSTNNSMISGNNSFVIGSEESAFTLNTQVPVPS